MDFILDTVFLVMVVQYSDGQQIIGNEYSDIMDDICRYRFHASPLPWNQAHEVCEGMSRTLAKIDNKEKLESVGNMATGNVSSRVPNANLSELWIGLRANIISNSVQHFWENCEELSNSGKADSFWINDKDRSVEGCIAMNPNVKKYTAIDCSEARPYICEAQATVPCYDKVDWDSESVFTHFSLSIKFDLMKCGSPCLHDDRCIAFQDHESMCEMLAIHSHSSTRIPNLYPRSAAYTFGTKEDDLHQASVSTTTCENVLKGPIPMTSKNDQKLGRSFATLIVTCDGFIDLTSRQIDATAVTPPAPCSNTVTPSLASALSSTLTATQEGLEDTTFTFQILHSTFTVLESSEPSYMTSGHDNRLSATTESTDPLNSLTPGLVETPSAVDSSIVCPNGGMTSEMISKKIRQIAEDLEDDAGKRISIWHSRKNNKNVEENHCAGDKTFPRGLELMSSINEMRKEIILSKLRQN